MNVSGFDRLFVDGITFDISELIVDIQGAFNIAGMGVDAGDVTLQRWILVL